MLPASAVFQVSGCNRFQNIYCFNFKDEKAYVSEIDLVVKRGHHLNNDGLESPILHTMFRGNQPTGPGEKKYHI